MEGDVVEVRDDLVNGSRGGSEREIWSAGIQEAAWRFLEAYSGAKRSLRRDSMRTFW